MPFLSVFSFCLKFAEKHDRFLTGNCFSPLTAAIFIAPAPAITIPPVGPEQFWTTNAIRGADQNSSNFGSTALSLSLFLFLVIIGSSLAQSISSKLSPHGNPVVGWSVEEEQQQGRVVVVAAAASGQLRVSFPTSLAPWWNNDAGRDDAER